MAARARCLPRQALRPAAGCGGQRGDTDGLQGLRKGNMDTAWLHRVTVAVTMASGEAVASVHRDCLQESTPGPRPLLHKTTGANTECFQAERG